MILLNAMRNESDGDQTFLIVQFRREENDDGIGVIRESETNITLKKIPFGEQVDLAPILTSYDYSSALIINVGAMADRIKNNSKTEFTNADIKKETGLTLRQIQYYTTDEIIKPISRGKGRGSFHKYSQENLLGFFIIRELWGYGVTLQKIKTIFEYLAHSV